MSAPPVWHALGPSPVHNEDEFVAFLEAVGICLWTPHPALDFPNLADKMELAKPDDIWGTWFWKDDLHEARRLYYGKLLGGRPTFVAMDMLPSVIAARGDIDPRTLHERGALTAEALRVYEALERHGELSTGDLRRAAGLDGAGARTAYDRAVTFLGALFQICKTGITGRTRGTYGYRWGLVERWIPETLARAARIRPHDAARTVAERLRGLGVEMTPERWRRLFGWDAETIAALEDP